MLDWSRLLIFVPVVLSLVITPGRNTLYIIARSLHGGYRAGIVSCLGISLATVIPIAAATVGLTASAMNRKRIPISRSAHFASRRKGTEVMCNESKNFVREIRSPSDLHQRRLRSCWQDSDMPSVPRLVTLSHVSSAFGIEACRSFRRKKSVQPSSIPTNSPKTR